MELINIRLRVIGQNEKPKFMSHRQKRVSAESAIKEYREVYIPELEKMGVKTRVLNPHQAEIEGGLKLRGTTIKSFDLRAGAALIIAALAAQGKTTIEEIYQVDRGYERIEERFSPSISRRRMT